MRAEAQRIVDLSGEWIGKYSTFEQVVRITQRENLIVATKVTGDEYVPADEITFRANVYTGLGEGRIAEYEFRNPRFVSGEIQILSPDTFQFYWENIGFVEFRRDE